jgi:hypothetical protein
LSQHRKEKQLAIQTTVRIGAKYAQSDMSNKKSADQQSAGETPNLASPAFE